MGFVDFLKTILAPAIISLLIYVALTYAILPFYRQHRQRYAQYLPMTTLSTQTSSLRSRISDAFIHFAIPSSWRNRGNPQHVRYVADSDGSIFDDEDGEGMVGFDVDPRRRETLQRSGGGDESERRLSRDLEEGFRDDSDDEARRVEGGQSQR